MAMADIPRKDLKGSSVYEHPIVLPPPSFAINEYNSHNFNNMELLQHHYKQQQQQQQQYNYLQRPPSSSSLSSSSLLRLRHHNLNAAQKINNRSEIEKIVISTTTTTTATATTTTNSLVLSNNDDNNNNNENKNYKISNNDDVMSNGNIRYSMVDCRLPKLVINNKANEHYMKTRNSSSRLKLVRTLWVQKNHWRLFITIVHLILYIVSPICLAARQDAVVNCTFPQRWEGSWFLSGYQQSIHIKGSQFSYRGKCTASDGNKYLIVDDRGCHRCLVIYEKHKNVLQYKESECEGDSMYMDQSNPAAMPMRSILKSDHRGGAHPNLNGHSRLSSSDQYIMRSNDDINDYFCKGRETLQNLCDQIPGDALLYSLFRENADPVKCPLKGPFTFTYNRGHGECKSPVSNIESCTEDSRLLLSFQACPDVQGTESTVEELTCLATWKDGNSRYLVGLVSHHHAISNEERYRCFVYEKISTLMSTIPGGLSNPNLKDAEYKLAQSGDATCNGLDSAEVGSRIMTLRKPPPAERCDFPIWFKGPKHWHALMGNAGYIFHSGDGSMHITKSNGYMETRALCEQINHQTSTEMMAVVHYTTGCQSGFMCMMFYRRDTHIAEIQTGTPAPRLEDACAPDHFDINKLPYITLLAASSSEPQICPLEGLYNLRGAIGPPYITSRHKRNHNNKGHNQHMHHHHDLGHKRHITLSFRNSEEFDHTSWHSQTRGLPTRNRRAAGSSDSTDSLSSSSSYKFVPMTMPIASSSSLSSKTSKIISTNELNNNKSLSMITHGSLTQSTVFNINDTQRNRRDVPGCTVNYKAQRQLWVGCTEPNVIEVRPQCSENGDEVYSCHGSWTENGTVYIIAKHAGTQHGVCISYRSLESNNAAKLIIGDACYRGLQRPPDHHLVANLTVFGKCGDTNSSNQIHNSWLLAYIKCGFTTLLLIFLINR